MKFIILLGLLTIVASVKYSCYQRTYYARVCYRFEFVGDCQPYQIEKCKPARTTTNDFRCPRYFCDKLPEWQDQDESTPKTPSSSSSMDEMLTVPPLMSVLTSSQEVASNEASKPLITSTMAPALSQLDQAKVKEVKAVKEVSSLMDNTKSFSRLKRLPIQPALPPPTEAPGMAVEMETLEKDLPLQIKKELLMDTELPLPTKLPVQTELPVQTKLPVHTESPVTESPVTESPVTESPIQTELAIQTEMLLEADLDSEMELPPTTDPTTNLPIPEILPIMMKQTELLRRLDKMPLDFLETPPKFGAGKKDFKQQPEPSSSSSEDRQKGSDISPQGFEPVSSELHAASPTDFEPTLTKPSKQPLKPIVPNPSKSFPNALPFEPPTNPSNLHPTYQLSPFISRLKIDNLAVLNGPSYIVLKQVQFPDSPNLKIDHESDGVVLDGVHKGSSGTDLDIKSYGPDVLAEYFRSRDQLSFTSSEIDCGNKICEMENRLQSLCRLHVAVNDSVECDYPCSEKNCAVEVHHWVECPIWTCRDKTTTTSTRAPPSPTPAPSAASQCSSALCIFSVVINILVFLVFTTWLSLYLHKRRSRSTIPVRSIENPCFDILEASRSPIIRTRSERIPLLSDQRSVRYLVGTGEERASPRVEFSTSTGSFGSLSARFGPHLNSPAPSASASVHTPIYRESTF